MVTRTLVNTGDAIVDPKGDPIEGATLTFALVDAVKRQTKTLFDAAEGGGELIRGDAVTATTDAAGLFTVDLWPNDRGEEATFYKVTLTSVVKPFYIRVTSGEGSMLLIEAKAAMEALQPQTLSLFEALLASITAQVAAFSEVVTTTVNGLMSYVDKVRLNTIWGATLYAESYDTLADADAAAVAAGKQLIITTQWNTVPATLSANIRVLPGGKFNNAGALSVNGPFKAGRHLVFMGAGAVKFGAATNWNDHTQVGYTPTVFPEWFTGGLQQAVYAVAAQTAASVSPTYIGGVVDMANTHYAVSGTTLIIPDHVELRGPNEGSRTCAIVATAPWTSAANPVVQIGRTLGTQYWSHGSKLTNCTVDANFLANVGIYSNNMNESAACVGVWVRNFLLKGVEAEIDYTVATDPRLMHTRFEHVHILCPFAETAKWGLYPNPEDVIGFHLHGTTDGASVASAFFSNYILDDITVTAGSQQLTGAAAYNGATTYAALDRVTSANLQWISLQNGNTGNTPASSPLWWKAVRYGAGIQVEGIAGVAITQSHAEYSTVGLKLGVAGNPVNNIKVSLYDGFAHDPKAIEINNDLSSDIMIENVSTQNCPIGISDTRTNGVDVNDTWIAEWRDGAVYNHGDTYHRGDILLRGDAPRYIISRTHGANHSQLAWERAAGTEASPSAVTVGQRFGAISARGYNGVAFGASKALFEPYASQTWTETKNGTAWALWVTPNDSTVLTKIMDTSDTGVTFTGALTATGFNLSALGTAPASASAAGTTGTVIVDASHIYVCTATNTWKRAAIATW
jgi:hypothetical protein